MVRFPYTILLACQIELCSLTRFLGSRECRILVNAPYFYLMLNSWGAATFDARLFVSAKV